MSVLERIPHECPKCGGEVLLLDAPVSSDDLHDVGTRSYVVMCPTCMIGSAPACFSRDAAFASWSDTKKMVEAELDLIRNRG